MYVGVNKPGKDGLTGEGHGLVGRPFKRPDTGDPSVGKHHVRGFDLFGEHVDDLTAPQHEITRLLSEGHADAPPERLGVNSRNGFGHRRSHRAIQDCFLVGT